MVRFNLNPPNRPKGRGLIPGRQSIRLASLVVALCMVTLLVALLQQPETAFQVDRAFGVAAGSDPSRPREVTWGDNVARAKLPADEHANPADFENLLALAGWNSDRLAELGDGQPLNDSQREELLELLRRLRSFDAADLAAWTLPNVSIAAIAADPTDYRGKLVRLVGRVTQVKRRTLPPELANRLELPAYIECEIALGDEAGTATIITARIPNAWTRSTSIDEPAEADGVFVRLLPASRDKLSALFVSRDIAWRPVESRLPHVSSGAATLGQLGMDVGLLDVVQQRRPILANERDAFYAMLAATRNANTNQLVRWAQEDLPAVRARWTGHERQLAQHESDSNRKQLPLAREVISRAEEGRYSVAPLFNEPARHVGDLFVLDGLARRATRIDVGTLPDGRPSEVARRFGIDHYYELEIFTDDSQGNPIVFCATSLPPGFPLGESIHEQVRVAGFFFKSWSFESRRAAAAKDDENSTTAAAARQFAPLLIGREPIWVQPASPQQSMTAQYVAATAFVVLVAGMWGFFRWQSARDRYHWQQWTAERFGLPPGESLDNLDLPDASDAEKSPPTH